MSKTRRGVLSYTSVRHYESVCVWRRKRHRWRVRHASCELSLDCKPPKSTDVGNGFASTVRCGEHEYC